MVSVISWNRPLCMQGQGCRIGIFPHPARAGHTYGAVVVVVSVVCTWIIKTKKRGSSDHIGLSVSGHVNLLPEPPKLGRLLHQGCLTFFSCAKMKAKTRENQVAIMIACPLTWEELSAIQSF